MRRSRADLPLARTFSKARWAEYDILLGAALEQGWVAVDLERWIAMGGPQERLLIIRHDVDQHPATAIEMARIDARHGISGTWYFRWRTCSLPAIRAIRELGGEIGFHYETLTRFALERRLTAEQISPELIEEARGRLRLEIDSFQGHVGPIRSICAHGDTRVPGVTNQVLVRGVDPAALGVEFDANEALSRHRLGLWMTDRSASDGGWKDGTDPLEVLRTRPDPVLCLTHPNNWCSGVSLWSDRIRAALTPAPPFADRRPLLGIRTGTDHPPDAPAGPRADRHAAAGGDDLPGAIQPRSFAPVGATLRREVARHRYEHGARLSSESQQQGLERDALVPDSAPAQLERVLAAAGLPGLRGRELLELGAGFGGLALLLAFQGARLTAVEADVERVRVASRVATEHAIEIELLTDNAALAPQRFDAAILSHAGAADRGALGAALSALRPGRVLAVHTPGRRPWRALGGIVLRRRMRRAGFAQIRREGTWTVAVRPPLK